MSAAIFKHLTPAQYDFFQLEGYLMVPDILDPSELEPVREELHQMIAGKAGDLIRNGELSPGDSHPAEGFNTRLARISEHNKKAAELIMKHLEGFNAGGYQGKALFEIITNAKLLDVVEDLIGPEIVGSSVYRLRPKLPKSGRGVIPWHQDSSFWMPHCDHEMIITCWMPLVHATCENGCLTILPRAHNSGLALHHDDKVKQTLAIREEDLPEGGERVVVPVPLGGAVFFTNRTPHCSTPNHTDSIRWSMDLRYQSADVPSNFDKEPEQFSMELPEYEISCNPPEADFLVRTLKYPERLITGYEQFQALRTKFEKGVDQSKVVWREWPVLK